MTVELPTALGVPVMFTEAVLLLDKVKPAGKLPERMIQVKGPVAPIVLMVALYGTSSVATGSELVSNSNTAFTVMVTLCVTVVLATDVAVTVAVVFVVNAVGAT